MENNELVMDAELETQLENSNEQADQTALNADGTESKPLSERDFKIAYAKAVKERQLAIKRNKEIIADKQLEVAYWKAEADLLRHRFEKMDFYLKNLEIEPRYLAAIEEQKAKELQNTVGNQKPLLD